MMKPSIYINGSWVDGEGLDLKSINPAVNKLIWSGLMASTGQVDQAISAARTALPGWEKLGFEKRCEYIRSFEELLSTHREALAKAIAEETGKPFWESLTEVTAMISKIAISIKAFKERTGDRSEDIQGATSVLRHKPHGAVAVFGPYNFPGHLPNGHIVPALLAGNTIVFKPSELTPKVAEQVVKLWEQTGLPEGVLNLIQGDRETGKALASHSGIDGLYFTGSSRTGHQLHKQFAGHPEKILALEMGGNNPLIIANVHPMHIKAAVHETIQSAFITSGQRCTCARRLFIPDDMRGEDFLSTLVRSVRKIKIGTQFDFPPPFMGSLISSAAADHILDVQTALIDLGATPILLSEKVEPYTGLLSPGLIDITHVAAVPDEEYFGPLLQLIRYKNLDDAIAQANATKYGLSAGIFTDDHEEYDQFYSSIRAGIVNWNKQLTGASSSAPFGGVGASGNHRASAYYAADYCAYPVAGLESPQLELPENLSPGLTLD